MTPVGLSCQIRGQDKTPKKCGERHCPCTSLAVPLSQTNSIGLHSTHVHDCHLRIGKQVEERCTMRGHSQLQNITPVFFLARGFLGFAPGAPAAPVSQDGAFFLFFRIPSCMAALASSRLLRSSSAAFAFSKRALVSSSWAPASPSA